MWGCVEWVGSRVAALLGANAGGQKQRGERPLLSGAGARARPQLLKRYPKSASYCNFKDRSSPLIQAAGEEGAAPGRGGLWRGGGTGRGRIDAARLPTGAPLTPGRESAVPPLQLPACTAPASLSSATPLTDVFVAGRPGAPPAPTRTRTTAARGHFELVQLVLETAVMTEGPEKAKKHCVDHANSKRQTALMVSCKHGCASWGWRPKRLGPAWHASGPLGVRRPRHAHLRARRPATAQLSFLPSGLDCPGTRTASSTWSQTAPTRC